MALKRTIIAKPFLKWAGGKTQLLPVLDAHLPARLTQAEDVTYIEPFVGGGAMLFHMLQKYSNIHQAVINDLNPRLINAYRVIRNTPEELIEHLAEIQAIFYELHDNSLQKEFFLGFRERFNNEQMTAILIFLNRTCFNGLYRENAKGKFNVPFGRYVNPTICDRDTIMANSRLLQRVTILHGDFSETVQQHNGYTFVYFDPPYRPLSSTSNFNSYIKEPFNDEEQIRLKEFVVDLSHQGIDVMVSNSDGKSFDPNDMFFDELYHQFNIERVGARRNINANATKRGITSELLIMNYNHCQGDRQIIQIPPQPYANA